MKVIYIKDHKKPTGRAIPKGTKAEMLNEAAQELIDKKIVRPFNVIDKAKEKIKNLSSDSEQAISTKDDETETRTTKENKDK